MDAAGPFFFYSGGGSPYLMGTAFTVAWKCPNLPRMKCKKGIWIDDLGQRVPCGQCMPCRINKGRQWSARIIMEWVECPIPSYFVTLTYAPEHIPENGTLDKKYVHQWVKDTQKRYTGPFRYYLVGEYGDCSQRPHYHLAIFPKHVAQIHAFQAAWKKGFVQATEINHARARYLANYTAKKLTKTRDPRLEGREPEFRSSSRNPPLGAAFVERLSRQPSLKKIVAQTGDVPRTFRIDGKIYPIGCWALTQLRNNFDIPQTHAGRSKANPNYLNHYPLEGAEWNPEEAELMEIRIDAKKKITFHRGEAPKI